MASLAYTHPRDAFSVGLWNSHDPTGRHSLREVTLAVSTPTRGCTTPTVRVKSEGLLDCFWAGVGEPQFLHLPAIM
jgi:hypothetical protein